MTSLLLERDTLANLEAATSREWLVTNGLGGYAAGTLSGCNTRRYHGLLVATLRPPIERTVMVAKIDLDVRYQDRHFSLTANEFADGTVDRRAEYSLHSFRLDGQIPVWTWSINDALIEQRIWMAHGKNTTYVKIKVLRASATIDFELMPLCTYRDYHSEARGERNFLVSTVERGLKVDAHWGAHPYRILAENAEFDIFPTWYWNFRHRAESERGLDDVEDLFRPAIVRARLSVGESASIVLTAESSEPAHSDEAFHSEIRRQAKLLEIVSSPTDHASRVTRHDPSPPHHASRITRHEAIVQSLTLAADQFIVERHNAAGVPLGKTVIAGYPWFSDWGRDTMIALPGLTLATQRFEEAASILRTFARFVSEGMLPNRFPDAGETPEYNTVDATLWYFVAVDEYYRATGDLRLLKELYPVLRDIVEWHLRGTRFGIRVDANDGLLFAGEEGVQLTWMDAKVGEWVVTPRIGKPVEINALWFNALSIMKDIALVLRDRDAVRGYATMADSAAKSFRAGFWSDSRGYLHDVIHGPEGDVGADGRRYDASLRPNQLFSLSLRHSLLDAEQARAIVDVCARELWTPVGMRSLARSDSWYSGHYGGSPKERDGVYHQGTVWSWLLGPFAVAHFRVYRDAELALSFLEGMTSHLREGCVGQISEIFDGNAPFAPRGCFAQAWGVSEVLRAWSCINENERTSAAALTPDRQRGESHARKIG